MINNANGIALIHSDNNTIVRNIIERCTESAIWLHRSSSNRFHHNYFADNVQQVHIETPGYANFWDNGSEGNYWSDYEERYPNVTEIDGSGIWDTPYALDENNQDNYPIVPEFPSFLVIPLFMTATLLAATLYRRKHSM